MGTVSCSQPTDYQILKMGVYDGVYQLDMSQADPNWAAMHKEMGIPEADTKAMISGGNVHTMTVMENKDGSFTTSTNNTVVPHHNSSFTSKPGEIKKMEKPFPLQDGDEDEDRQDRRLRDELHRARGLRDYDRWRVKRLLLLQETWRFRGNLEGVL